MDDKCKFNVQHIIVAYHNSLNKIPENQVLNNAFTKVAPKNVLMKKCHPLSDWLALAISYDLIGYLGCIIFILHLYVGKLVTPTMCLVQMKQLGQNNRIRTFPRKKEKVQTKANDYIQKKERENLS